MERNTKRSAYDWLLEVLAVVGLLWAFWPLLAYGSLGEGVRIPVHFNASGEIDGWGGGGFFWFIFIMALAMYVMFKLFEKYPQKLNYPVKVTKANAPKLYGLAIRLIRHINVFVMFMFAYINNSILIAAETKEAPQTWVIWAIVAVMLAVCTVYAVKIYRVK